MQEKQSAFLVSFIERHLMQRSCLSLKRSIKKGNGQQIPVVNSKKMAQT
jgi:hypothetical protein